MKTRNTVLSILAVLTLTAVATAGGWATITLNDFPDHAVAGAPMKLTFIVRQHGQTLLSGLQPTIRATTTSGLSAKGTAAAAAKPGEYTAALTLPQPGEWTITITSGFNESNLTLPALKVIAAGAPAPAPFTAATRGLRLFSAKGCTGCHTHFEVNPKPNADARLNLTGKRFQHDYLKRFLADPGIKPAEMPNLNLKQDEIEALAAFINKGEAKKSPPVTTMRRPL